jgi:acyl carrier protein
MHQELEHVVAIVCKVGKISGIGPDEDFYEAGFSSISALELLLELETAYVVSIPDDWFIAARSIRSLCKMIDRLKQERVA